MIKRTLKIIIWLPCLPLVFLSILFIPIMAIFAVAKYIFTGEEDEDILLAPMEWVMNLPYNLTKKW